MRTLTACSPRELPGLDRDEIRRWYNGYAWLGEQRVYNPFDILLLFDRRKFDAYWFGPARRRFWWRPCSSGA